MRRLKIALGRVTQLPVNQRRLHGGRGAARFAPVIDVFLLQAGLARGLAQRFIQIQEGSKFLDQNF